MRIVLSIVVALLLLAAPAAARAGQVQLGTALNSGGLGDRAYTGAVGRYDAVTPESALKFAELHPAADRYDFAFGDTMVDWARANGKPMHGTTLIWCTDEYLPDWLLSRSWTRAELIRVMEDHVSTVMRHFRGRVPAWDVVNEAFAANGSRRDCLWQRVIGADWIERALRAARAADPDAKLFYNETAADLPNSKFAAVEAMAKDFRARGVPLDGVGLQNHLLNGSAPLQFLAEDAMRRLGALGLAVHVSELDAFISQFGGTPEEALDRQAQAFQTVASACQAVEACFRVTLWGAADGWSWRGTEQKAVALDASYREKPGWWGIQEAIGRAGAPAGQAPSPPGQPAASASPNTGVFEVSWPAAWDIDGDRLNYRLEHRDADDAGWSPVATGIRSLGFSFAGGRLERQGTYRYRAVASDGRVAGGFSEVSEAVVVDRSDPAPPAIAPDRAPDGGGWYRDAVTLTFAAQADPPLLDGSPGSGVDAATVPAPSRFAATGAHTVTGIVRDRAGNASRSATATVRVDADAPRASLACPGPVEAGDPASASWTASDTGSGLAGPATGTLALDTSRAGTFTARHEAADVAGHRTPVTCQYVVRARPEPVPEPTAEPTATPTASPTATPTASPTATPTASPTAVPTASPTATPTASPTATPTASPTATPTASPTATPAPEPTAAPAPAQQGGPALDAAGAVAPLAVSAPAVRSASRVAADGRVRIRLACATACSGRLSLRARGRTLAHRRFGAAAGRVTVVLRLARRDRRRLARTRRIPARAVLEFAGGSAAPWRVILRR